MASQIRESEQGTEPLPSPAHMSFRDSSVVVIETGRTQIRAGHGLHELLRTPTVV